MIINSIIGSKRGTTSSSVSLTTTMPYTDFIKYQGDSLVLEFNYASNDNATSSGLYFVDGTFLGDSSISENNTWDISSYLAVNSGPKLMTFRVNTVDYELNTAKIDFRVIHDYIDYPNMIFGLTMNGNFSINGYSETVIQEKVIDVFKYSYIDGYGIKIVTEVGDAAFSGRMDIDKIILPDTITKIGNGAFANCGFLSVLEINAEIPPALTSTNAFDGTEPQFKIKVPAGSVLLYQTDWAGKLNNATIEAL